MATIKSSGGDYTTVALWEADTDNDLTGAGVVTGEIYDVNPTATLSIAGATNTDASNYRHLTVNSAFRHAGVWDTGKMNFQASTTGGSLLGLSEAFCRVSYVQVKNTHATAGDGGISVAASTCMVSQCIVWYTAPGAGNTASGISISTAGTSSIVRNCATYSSRNGIYDNHSSASSVEIDNCTCVGNTLNGIRSANAAALTIKNCYAGGNTGDDYNEGGGAGWTSWTATTCMCADAITETGLTNSVAYSTANFTNVTAGSVDVHLVTGSALIGAGTDLSADFSDDFDGTTRSSWDVGPDEFASGATDYSGTGALAAQAAAISGAGLRKRVSTGTPAAQAAAIAGTGLVGRVGSGALTAPAAAIIGAGTVGRTGSGGLTAQAAALAGAGTVGRTGDGTLLTGASSISGAGTVNRVASGGLQAQDATISGSGTASGAPVQESTRLINWRRFVK